MDLRPYEHRNRTVEFEEIFIDTADGFPSHRNIYDSLSTQIMMFEDAKLSKKDMYIPYSDFKGAFGGMDYGILFPLMKEYGLQVVEAVYTLSKAPNTNTDSKSHT
jgi:hypothetical protein